MNKRYQLAWLAIFCIPFLSLAQQSPGFGCSTDQLMQSMPALLSKQAKLDNELRLNIGAKNSAAPLPYVLPVVVHIIHNNGLENILDAQVFAAIEHMNQAFAHEGYYLQQGDGTNTQIQFCLAQRTPDGQLTNGITRTISTLTDMVPETNDLALKDLERWDPTQYINIWVVNSITSASAGAGVAGYAYLASSHGEPNDGVVCEAATFGVDAAQEGVLIHEMGHFLNLYHTFEGGCGNGDCLSDGDRVCDTPPDQATHTACPYNSCSTDADDTSSNNPFSTNVDDPTENFLDYSPFGCYRKFTEGQAERMRYAIEFFRKSLLTSEGCKSPCLAPIATAFLPSATTVTAGQTVNFTNQTVGATNYEWYVNGNLIATTTNFSYQFTGTGNALVELRAYNADPNCLGTANANIVVNCGVQPAFTVNATELPVGETLICTNTSTGATGYEWFINGVSVSTGANMTYIFSNTGFYTVTLQATGDYCNASKTLTIEVSTGCETIVKKGTWHYSDNHLFWGTYAADDGYFFDSRPNLQNGASVFKMDTNGNLLWKKTIEVNLRAETKAATSDGGCITVLDGISGPPLKNRICKFSGNGDIEWAKKIDYEPDYTDPYVVTTNDNIYVIGHHVISGKLMMQKFNLDGTVVWNKTYQNLPNQSIYIEGVTLNTDTTAIWIWGDFDGGSNPFAAKFNLNGDLIFSKKFTNPQNAFSNYVQYLMPIPDGGFVTVLVLHNTTTGNNEDFVLARWDSQGNKVWAKKLESNAYGYFSQINTSITIKPDGKYLLYFQKDQLNPFLNYIASFTPNGNLEFAEKYTGSYYFDNNITVHNGQLKAWLDPPNANVIMADLDSDGHFTDCTDVLPYNISPVNYNVSMTNSNNLTLSQYTVPLLQDTIVEFGSPDDVYLVKECLITVACPEDCGNDLDDDEDGFVDCFDSDCQCFDGNDCTTDALEAAPIKGQLEWQSSNFAGINAIPLVANMDPQNGDIPEIIVMEGISDNLTQMTISKVLFYKGDGSNANNPRTLTIPQLMNEREACPVIGDVNGDGIPELAVVTWDYYIRVYTNYSPTNAQAMTLYATSDMTTFWTSAHLGMADFDGDGKPEIYSGHQVFQFDFTNPTSPQLKRKLVGFGFSGSNSIQTVGSIAADVLSVADCNGDPDCAGLELVAGATIYSVDLDPSDGDGLEIKAARTLTTMVPSDNFLDGYNYVADLNNDGILDIVTTGRHGSSSNFGFYAWNKNGLLRKFTAPFPQQFDRQFYTAAIANVFDDKTKGFAQDFPEIIYASSNYITAFNLQAAQQTPNAPWWWTAANDDPSGASGPSCFDFNADGFAEIIHRDEKSLRLMYGGPLPLPAGVDADRNWVKIPCNSQTIDEYPIVADVDNDGEAEIVATGYPPPFIIGQPDYRGKLYVMGSDNLPWAPTRKVWNQFNYFGVNVNDDLSIPAQQQLHHLEFPGIGSGKRPFNTSHTQWSPLNDNFEPGFPVSDATVTVDSFACNGNNTLVWITLCNTGSNLIPANYPIAFYKNDPRLPGANIETGISHGPNPIPVDSCISLVVPMPTVLNAPIFVVVGDDASQTLPYSLSDFPISDVLECNYANNFASFTLPTQGSDLDLGPDRVLCSSSVTELNAGAGFVSYRWQNGSTDSTFTAYSPGKYWVDANDLCGFLHTDTLVISLNQSATVDLGADRFLCAGESVTLDVSGFAEVQWSPTTGLSCADCPSVTLTPTDTITYYVTAANGNCIATDSVRIFTETQPSFSLLTQDGDCTTAASITANASGTAPFSYEWSSGETTPSIQPAQAGTYSVTVTSAHGCTSTGTAMVAFTNSLQLDIQSTPLPCTGSFGEASVTANGGAAPYTYVWSNGGNSATVQVATPGNLTVTITDANGCIKTASVNVGVIGDLSLDLSSEPVPCTGVYGEASAIANGGTAPFTYAWSNGGSTPTVQVVNAGNYTVTITDANVCTSTGAVNVESIAALSLQLETTPVSCGGQSGEASVEVSGGTAPFGYSWSNGENTPTITTSSPGDFIVTVTDANGCTNESTATVGSTGSLDLDVQETPVTCSGVLGTASINASGGLAPYTYAWSNGGNTSNIQVSVPGSFTVTVTDATGCVSTTTATIGLAGQLSLGITIDAISCFGASDGTATIIPVNGTAPYNYLWANGNTGPEQTNISGGSFSVTVTDAIGCTDHLNFNILPPTPLELAITATDATCFGQNNGTATVTASGGTPGYSYFWSNVQTEATAIQLAPGWQTVSVTDENGCTDTTGILITQPTMMNATVLVDDPLICQGASTTVTVTATGGTPSYTYLWGNGETSSSVTASTAGAYIVTVTDANDCVTFGTGFLQVLPPIVVQLDSMHTASSPTAADGSIFVNATGTQPLQYLWSNGATTEDLLNVPTGNYSLTVTDSEGCEKVYEFTVDFLNATTEGQGPDWNVMIYPNPTNINGDAATLSILSQTAQTVDFQLFDVTGKLLDKKRLEVTADGWKETIQAPDVAGMYLILLSNEREVICLKWVVL